MNALLTDGMLNLIVLAAVFGCVALLSFWAVSTFGRSAPPNRLARPAGPASASVQYGQNALSRSMTTLPERLMPKNEEQQGAQRKFLARAGYRSPWALRTYYAARIVSTLVTAWLGLWVAYMFDRLPDGPALFLTTGLVALLGYFLPWLFVYNAADKRATALSLEFPDALDLMLVCVESGLGVDAALARVADEMAQSHPVAAEELKVASLELRAGRSREEVLHRLSERTTADGVRSFCNLLIQSARIGASIGEALRVAADELRNKRLMRAEETAAKIPVKMMIPMVLFMMPTMMIVVAAPAVVKALTQVAPVVGG